MFQSNAFQNFAFQTVGAGIAVVTAALNPNGGSPYRDYTPSYYEVENHRRKIEAFRDSEREAEVQLKSINYKLEELELRRLRNLADETMQLELIALLKEQFIINEILKELQIKKAAMMRDEDDMLIILLSMSF